MRFLTGLVVGVLLTIGTAYVVDAMHSAPGPDDKTSQRMVNWGVVGDNLSVLSSSAQSAWAKLVGGAKEIEKKVQEKAPQEKAPDEKAPEKSGT